ncbi:hypothetical protein Ahy_B04g072526 [Arachis hypogaea]|uniref:Amino acid transporter transmembrane domain-containing protein n=1 Tax=Arachis hypogaea TaxID=3818 RepID=A0A444ZNF1_ARAHY|nr:hypothetical protein Ahy_B04g072526 [Arachis hypogaea]
MSLVIVIGKLLYDLCFLLRNCECSGETKSTKLQNNFHPSSLKSLKALSFNPVIPVSSFVLHPILSYYNNRCTCKLGCHCSFILVGAVTITIALLTIGFAKDFSYAFGDNLSEKTRPRALAIFGIGF